MMSSQSPEKRKMEEPSLSESRLYEFNPVVDSVDVDTTNNYPTLRSIIDKNPNESATDFNFKFDDMQQNTTDNLPWNNNLDFNFG
jgi:hypothetical protein